MPQKRTDKVNLVNPTNNPLVAKLIDHLKSVEVVYEVWSEDESIVTELRTDSDNTKTLMFAGDDAWGSLTCVEEVNGHLIFTANYGDEGELEFCATVSNTEGGCMANIPGVNPKRRVCILTSENVGLMTTFNKH